MSILNDIQSELKAPKGQYNSFGKYNYRSCEDILEALKPLLKAHKSELFLSDKLIEVGGRIYVEATATFKAGDESVVVTASAREPETKKGMDEAQITGTASSYARKYALNGLFLIDDAKDADTDEYKREQSMPSKPAYTESQMAEMKKWADGTFTKDELAKIKSDLGNDFKGTFDKASKEYAKRKAGTPSAADEVGASKAFEQEIF